MRGSITSVARQAEILRALRAPPNVNAAAQAFSAASTPIDSNPVIPAAGTTTTRTITRRAAVTICLFVQNGHCSARTSSE